MIRVVIRHALESASTLLGDFPPSEIPHLLELLDTADFYFGLEDGVNGVCRKQMVRAGGPNSQRWVLELVVGI